jgi:hypothetical protein
MELDKLVNQLLKREIKIIEGGSSRSGWKVWTLAFMTLAYR